MSTLPPDPLLDPPPRRRGAYYVVVVAMVALMALGAWWIWGRGEVPGTTGAAATKDGKSAGKGAPGKGGSSSAA